MAWPRLGGARGWPLSAPSVSVSTPVHILPELTQHIPPPTVAHRNSRAVLQPCWGRWDVLCKQGVGGVRWRQEGVNGDLAKSWKGGSGGGSPPPSQEFLKSEGGVGATSGAVGGLSKGGAGVTVSLSVHLPQAATLHPTPSPLSSSSSAQGKALGCTRTWNEMTVGSRCQNRVSGNTEKESETQERDRDKGRERAKRCTETGENHGVGRHRNPRGLRVGETEG